MRKILILPLVLAACSGEAEVSGFDDDTRLVGAGQWGDGDRSGLCVVEDGAASFILYEDGDGDTNCSASGEIWGNEDESFELAFVPRGDEQCSIPLARDGDMLTFGNGGEACSYYCGGAVSTEGRALTQRTVAGDTPTDPAGDAIC